MRITITPEIFTQYIKNKEARAEREKAAQTAARDTVSVGTSARINYSGEFINSVDFLTPHTLSNAIFILNNNSKISDEIFLLNGSVFKNLVNLSREIADNGEIGDIKVKSLLGIGQKSFTFETEDGKALKFTKGNHFPDGRDVEDFDIPVEKSGKILPNGKFHYYLEEKATLGNMTKADVKELIKQVREKGYMLVDYRQEDLFCGSINYSQFGRGKNGKAYLLDHECAIRGGNLSAIKSFLKTLFRLR